MSLKLNKKGNILIDLMLGLSISYLVIIYSTSLVSDYSLETSKSINNINEIVDTDLTISAFLNNINLYHANNLFKTLNCSNVDESKYKTPIYEEDNKIIIKTIKEGFFVSSGVKSGDSVYLGSISNYHKDDNLIIKSESGHCVSGNIQKVENNGIVLDNVASINALDGNVAIYNIKSGFKKRSLMIENNNLILDEDGELITLLSKVDKLIFQYAIKDGFGLEWLSYDQVESQMNTNKIQAARFGVFVKNKKICNEEVGWIGGSEGMSNACQNTYQYVINYGR